MFMYFAQTSNMNKITLLSFSCFLLFFSFAVIAQTTVPVYISKAYGNNTNDGLTEQTAWKDFAPLGDFIASNPGRTPLISLVDDGINLKIVQQGEFAAYNIDNQKLCNQGEVTCGHDTYRKAQEKAINYACLTKTPVTIFAPNNIVTCD